MPTNYAEQKDAGYCVAGARVSLDSIVYAFRGGESPETIQQNFPSLTLEQVYGAIAFYLGHRDEVDNDMAERKRAEEEFTSTHPAPRELKEKLDHARQQLLTRRI